MPGELASAQARIVELEAALAESTRQREKLQHKVARLDEQSFKCSEPELEKPEPEPAPKPLPEPASRQRRSAAIINHLDNLAVAFIPPVQRRRSLPHLRPQAVLSHHQQPPR